MKNWVFNPFNYIAGSKALLLGIAIITLSALLGYFSNNHFDGVIDIHIGAKAPFLVFLVEGLINLFCISLFLLIFSAIFLTLKFRIIDVVGTQAFARLPLIIVPIIGIFLPQGNIAEYIQYTFLKIGNPISISNFEIAGFIIYTIISLVSLAMMITWMYNAYRVSSNIKGAKIIISFIVSVLLAEILSKYLLSVIYYFLNQ